MQKSTAIYVGVGTNMGDRAANINQAYLLLEKKGIQILQKSSIYVSPPWGFEAEQDFYNSVICIESKLTPEDLLEVLHSIENEMGRQRLADGTYTSRIIDLDILDFNSEIIELGKLRIPHASMHLRRFVLEPLAELNPHWKHPENGLKIERLLTSTDLTGTLVKLGVDANEPS